MNIIRKSKAIKRVNFVNQDNTFVIEQLKRLTYSGLILNKRKKISKIMKTVQLFNFNNKKEYFDALIKANDLHYTDQEVRNIKEYLDVKSSHTITIENYDFICQEINEDDLEYSKGKMLIYREIQFFLYKLSKYIITLDGKRVLARNYLIKFKDGYKKNTKRTLNTHKIGHMLKILEKYEYLDLSLDHRIFRIGKNHPLFYTDCISEVNRQCVLAAPDTELLKTNTEEIKTLLRDMSRENVLLKDNVLEKDVEISKLKKEMSELTEALKVSSLKFHRSSNITTSQLHPAENYKSENDRLDAIIKDIQNGN